MTVTRTLYIQQGATYTYGFTWHEETPGDPPTVGAPQDLTGCEARLQIRKKQHLPVQLEATTANGKIILGGATGRVDLSFTDEDTDLLDTKASLYDLEIVYPPSVPPDPLYPAGRVVRLLEGTVVVSPNITQIDTEDAKVR